MYNNLELTSNEDKITEQCHRPTQTFRDIYKQAAIFSIQWQAKPAILVISLKPVKVIAKYRLTI